MPWAIWGLTSKWFYYLFISTSISLFLYFYRLSFTENEDLHYTCWAERSKSTLIQAVFLGGVREVSFKSYFLSLVGYMLLLYNDSLFWVCGKMNWEAKEAFVKTTEVVALPSYHARITKPARETMSITREHPKSNAIYGSVIQLLVSP